jgi:uncharacterized protein
VALRYRVVLFFLACTVVSSVEAQVIAPKDRDCCRTITVAGRGVVEVVPDRARTELGVAVFDLDAKKAKAAVDNAVTKVVAMARNLGVAGEQMKTAALNLEAKYDREEGTKLLGYQASRSVTVVVDPARLDALLEGAVDAGANNDFKVELMSSRESELRKDALSRAIEDARSLAEVCAGRLGVKVGPLKEVSTTGVVDGYPLESPSAYVSHTKANFLPGTIKNVMVVTVTFEIQ